MDVVLLNNDFKEVLTNELCDLTAGKTPDGLL